MTDKCWSYDEEHYYEDFEDVCERAFDDAYPEKPDTVTIDEADVSKYRASDFLEEASYVLEKVVEDAYERAGDFAEGWLENVSKAATDELDKKLKTVFDEWAVKHKLEPHFWNVCNIKEIKVREVDDPRQYVIIENDL